MQSSFGITGYFVCILIDGFLCMEFFKEFILNVSNCHAFGRVYPLCAPYFEPPYFAPYTLHLHTLCFQDFASPHFVPSHFAPQNFTIPIHFVIKLHKSMALIHRPKGLLHLLLVYVLFKQNHCYRIHK